MADAVGGGESGLGRLGVLDLTNPLAAPPAVLGGPPIPAVQLEPAHDDLARMALAFGVVVGAMSESGLPRAADGFDRAPDLRVGFGGALSAAYAILGLPAGLDVAGAIDEDGRFETTASGDSFDADGAPVADAFTPPLELLEEADEARAFGAVAPEEAFAAVPEAALAADEPVHVASFAAETRDVLDFGANRAKTWSWSTGDDPTDDPDADPSWSFQESTVVDRPASTTRRGQGSQDA
ncbi:MAG: hypothetical protein H6737_30165 [Alphaproteobacteria bacterium]|nr:hypothetical protein [Alphaproteobacteria bacterium]